MRAGPSLPFCKQCLKPLLFILKMQTPLLEEMYMMCLSGVWKHMVNSFSHLKAYLTFSPLASPLGGRRAPGVSSCVPQRSPPFTHFANTDVCCVILCHSFPHRVHKCGLWVCVSTAPLKRAPSAPSLQTPYMCINCTLHFKLLQEHVMLPINPALLAAAAGPSTA